MLEEENSQMSFLYGIAYGDSFRKFQHARNELRRRKWPRINFPAFEINGQELNNHGGYYSPKDNTITIFLEAWKENPDGAQIERRIYHEFAHWVDYDNNTIKGKYSSMSEFKDLGDDRFVTEYAKTDDGEAWAECFSYYMLDMLEDKLNVKEYFDKLFNTFQYETYLD